ncbi:hypothetical protein [Endozoicomonas sp. ONNA2]|uniref:hypothetical protein n=1 Tax=Endozoicomonas sp. ONNA2 TaxID=2828741 RepID=UPI0021484AFC|nr:hypothetical protein [Endozoicomonas sp. ONNA2]
MNINSGADSATNVIISSSVIKDTLAMAGTMTGLAFGFLVSTGSVHDNFLNRALYVGACGTAGYLIAQSAYHGCTAFWQSTVEIRDTVSTYMNNLGITPTFRDSHIVKACTYAGALCGLGYSDGITSPARDASRGENDQRANPPGFMGRIQSGTGWVMVGAGAGYLLGKGLEYTAEAAISGAERAAKRLGLTTAVSVSPDEQTRNNPT